MRILYLSQYFPPEIGATQTRAYEMAMGLVKAGHQVTMLTELPNHPTGIIPPEYRGRLWDRIEMDGIDVLRVWVKASPVKTFGTRMAFYLSYMLMATLAGLFKARGRYDLLYVTSPPLFVGGAGLALSYLRRLPLVFEVRDLWPESAVQLGELRSARAERLATWLEERCYRRARRIVAVTRGIETRLIERGYPDEKIEVIPNGANTEIYKPMAPDPELRRSLGLEPGQYVVTYTGLHGLAHGLETVLETAHLLRDQPEIVFLMIGDGPEKAALVQRAGELGLPNLIFHGGVPDRELPRYLALADVGLHTSRRLAVCRGALPVKMFSYMACRLPVVLAVEGEAAELLAQAQAGVVVPPESPEALAEAILRLRSSPEAAAQYGRRGLAYVRSAYSRQALASRLTSLLADVRSM